MNKVDIVHLHTFHPAIAIATMFIKTKIVYTLHGLSSTKQKEPIKSNIKELFKKYLLTQIIHHTTFNSHFSQRIASKQYGLLETKISLVPNGTKLSIAPSPNKNDTHFLSIAPYVRNQFIVGTTTRFTEQKCLERLIKAFAIFQQTKNTATRTHKLTQYQKITPRRESD